MRAAAGERMQAGPRRSERLVNNSSAESLENFCDLEPQSKIIMSAAGYWLRAQTAHRAWQQ